MNRQYKNTFTFFAFLLLSVCLAGGVHAAVFTVTNTNDTGTGSLRQAVLSANSAPTDDTIEFAPSLRGATITLSSEIFLGGSGTLLVDGPGADLLTIDGGPGDNRIFQQGGIVTIHGLTLQNGGGPGFNDIGAAIRGNSGTLAIDSVVIQNNQSTSNGVLFFQLGSGHSITNSTISGNQALVCSGFRADRTTLTITNSTISGNSTTAFNGAGGCVEDAATVNVYNSTISGNTAGGTGAGGGLSISGGSGPSTVIFSNSIVAGNFAQTSPDLLISSGSTVQTLGGNVIGDNSSVSTTFPNGNPNANLDRVGVSPLLGPLGMYGGTTPTRPLLSGSPALDTGLSLVQTPATDQRGAPRSGGIDAGAFEANAVYSAVLTPGTVNVAYNGILVPNNNGFTYSQTGGTLPPGLSLTTSFAPEAVVAVGGTPTFSGTYNFAVAATNGANSFVTNYTLVIAAGPSAADVSVSGRVMTADGTGLRNAVVVLTDQGGVSRTAVSSPLGYFAFEDVASGQTYVVTVESKRYSFTPQILNISDDISDLSFTAQ